MALVTIAVVCIYLLDFNHISNYKYIYPDNEHGSLLYLWLERWIVIFLLLNNLIPISLYVTLEMINVGQSYLISQDIFLYDKCVDTPCIVKNSNMCQEIGCVTHIFTDKTGTLTRNEMTFL